MAFVLLIDMRVYMYHPNRFRPFLKYYHERGFAMTSRHLGTTLGVYASESGVQNRTFQLFAYESTAHRDQCRKGLLSDEEWHNFTQVAGEALIQQQNTLLQTTRFSPYGGEAPDPVMSIEGRRLFEITTYSFQPGKGDEALALIEGEWAPRAAQLVEYVVAYMRPITGTDQFVALWAFKDSTARGEQHAALAADARFAAAESKLSALCTHKDNAFLLPTEDSPCR